MRILITGWYGTETIGDRAILASLLMHINSIKKNIEISIASIYPFHTFRTIIEDSWIYINICDVPETILKRIKIIDSRNIHDYSKAVRECDLLVMGGGPFDDMASMHMVEYGFQLARKKRKLTCVYGCGLNVLKKAEFIKSSFNILGNSDSIILRDSRSIQLLREYGYGAINNIRVAIDPAVFVAMRYKEHSTVDKKNNTVINLRDFPSIYSDSSNCSTEQINKKAFVSVDAFIKKSNYDSSKGVAMNYFAVGGDDRQIMNMCRRYISSNFEVENRALTLKETMDYFLSAKRCLGMRFHAVVLQTILNGNNYILNYTSSSKGKIPGFVDQIKGTEFYRERIINLQDGDFEMEVSDKCFKIPHGLLQEYDDLFLGELRELIK